MAHVSRPTMRVTARGSYDPTALAEGAQSLASQEMPLYRRRPVPPRVTRSTAAARHSRLLFAPVTPRPAPPRLSLSLSSSSVSALAVVLSRLQQWQRVARPPAADQMLSTVAARRRGGRRRQGFLSVSSSSSAIPTPVGHFCYERTPPAGLTTLHLQVHLLHSIASSWSWRSPFPPRNENAPWPPPHCAIDLLFLAPIVPFVSRRASRCRSARHEYFVRRAP